MPEKHRLAPQVGVEDNVRVERYDIGALREEISKWDQLTTDAKVRVLEAVPAVEAGESSNVTCVALHEYYPDVLTVSSAEDAMLDPVAEIGFGDDDSSFLTSDTELNNEVGSRTRITDATPTGTSVQFDEYLSSNEQNGNTLRELGVFSEGGDLYQHAPFPDPVEKTSNDALIISISLSHGDV